MATVRMGPEPPEHPSARSAEPPPADVLLSIPQVARRLFVARSTVYGLIATGDLQAVRIGRARRVPQSSVDRFIAERLRREERAQPKTRR